MERRSRQAEAATGQAAHHATAFPARGGRANAGERTAPRQAQRPRLSAHDRPVAATHQEDGQPPFRRWRHRARPLGTHRATSHRVDTAARVNLRVTLLPRVQTTMWAENLRPGTISATPYQSLTARSSANLPRRRGV